MSLKSLFGLSKKQDDLLTAAEDVVIAEGLAKSRYCIGVIMNYDRNHPVSKRMREVMCELCGQAEFAQTAIPDNNIHKNLAAIHNALLPPQWQTKAHL